MDPTLDTLNTLESYYSLSHVLDTYDGLCIMFGIPSPIYTSDDHYHALDIIGLIERCSVGRPRSEDRDDYIDKWENFAQDYRYRVNPKYPE